MRLSNDHAGSASLKFKVARCSLAWLASELPGLLRHNSKRVRSEPACGQPSTHLLQYRFQRPVHKSEAVGLGNNPDTASAVMVAEQLVSMSHMPSPQQAADNLEAAANATPVSTLSGDSSNGSLPGTMPEVSQPEKAAQSPKASTSPDAANTELSIAQLSRQLEEHQAASQPVLQQVAALLCNQLDRADTTIRYMQAQRGNSTPSELEAAAKAVSKLGNAMELLTKACCELTAAD